MAWPAWIATGAEAREGRIFCLRDWECMDGLSGIFTDLLDSLR